MMTEYTLHKLPQGFIITSDEDINIGEQYLDDSNFIRRSVTGEGEYWRARNNYKKVIAQQDQIDFSFLSEDEQKKIGWFDVDKLKLEKYPIDRKFNDSFESGLRIGFIEGFQKAQELLSDRMFTLEDMKKAFNAGDNYRYYENGGFRSIPSDVLDEEQFIESLSQKSWKIELEMNDRCKCGTTCEYEVCIHESKPKLTNGKIKILKLL
jgi:hypothetical protein